MADELSYRVVKTTVVETAVTVRAESLEAALLKALTEGDALKWSEWERDPTWQVEPLHDWEWEDEPIAEAE